MSDNLLDTPIEPAHQALAARLTLASIDGDADRVEQGLTEAVADPNTAVAVIALMSKHLSLLLTATHGAAEARGFLQKTITDAAEAADGRDD